MDPQYIQNLRYKLQKRISRLNAVDTQDSFLFTLAQFWRFFDKQPTFVGIIEELLYKHPDMSDNVDMIFSGTGLYGETEEEAAAIGYGVLKRLIENDNTRQLTSIGMAYRRASQNYPAIEAIREIHLEPFYEYVDEQLDDRRAMLALLLRYKHRSEWFHREKLWEKSQIEGKGEAELALDLYAYLYDQGIDFNIETESVRGRIDLFAAQGTEDPLLLDAKVFDGISRAKQYIRKGFRQIYTYTQHHNEPFGYLVIYNVTDKDLRFTVSTHGDIPTVVHNHKTIFLITIDIYQYKEPVSKRPPLSVVEITEEELITADGST